MRLQHAPTRARKGALLTGGAGRRCGVRATASSTLMPTTFSTHGLKLGKTKPLNGYREPASAILHSAFTCPLMLSARSYRAALHAGRPIHAMAPAERRAEQSREEQNCLVHT